MSRKLPDTAQAAPAAAGKHGAPLIAARTLRQLYHDLRHAREAVFPAALLNLRAGDTVLTSSPGLLETISLPRGVRAAAVEDFAAAVGVALEKKLRQKGGIVLMFATGRQPDARTLTLLARERLPLVAAMIGKAAAAGSLRGDETRDENLLPAIPVDQHDAVAIYRVAFESIQRARNGGGPTLIHCIPFHVNSRQQAQDPLAIMEHYLTGKGLLRRQSKQ